MADRCSLPTTAEKRGLEIEERARRTLMEKIDAALDEASAAPAAGFRDQGLDGPAPAIEYFASVVHQQMYCVLCGADPHTFAGGNAETAKAVIRNARNIARHYWGADLDP